MSKTEKKKQHRHLHWKNFINFFLGPVIVILLLVNIYFLYTSFLPGKGICFLRLTRDDLNISLELGTQFLLNNQTASGDFHYEYNWKTKKLTTGNNQVRQAGAMWGLALIYQETGSADVREAIFQAMSFFEKNSKLTKSGSRFVIYPGDRTGRVGTVALSALTYIDFLRADLNGIPRENIEHCKVILTQYLDFLCECRFDGGRFYSSYSNDNGKPFGKPSPYFEGEALLALIKAARYLDYDYLRELVIESAEAGYDANIKEALKIDPDSDTTKGYYQWSSMAFYEISGTNWPDTKKFGSYVLDLADWMIDVHKTLKRTRNTAYAYEGIIHAWHIASMNNDSKRSRKYRCVIDSGLRKLTSWQIGHPLMNYYIKSSLDSKDEKDPLAYGGIQNHALEAPLRIDVTQHQMHAVILARKYVYTE